MGEATGNREQAGTERNPGCVLRNHGREARAGAATGAWSMLYLFSLIYQLLGACCTERTNTELHLTPDLPPSDSPCPLLYLQLIVCPLTPLLLLPILLSAAHSATCTPTSPAHLQPPETLLHSERAFDQSAPASISTSTHKEAATAGTASWHSGCPPPHFSHLA